MPMDPTMTPPDTAAPPPADVDSPAAAAAEGHDFTVPPPEEPLTAKIVADLDAEVRAFLGAALGQDIPSIAGPIAQDGKTLAGPLPKALAMLALTLQDVIAKVGGPKWARRVTGANPEELRTNTGLRAIATLFRLATKDKELTGKAGAMLHSLAKPPGGGAPPPAPMPRPSPVMAGKGTGAPMPAPTPPRPGPQIMRAMPG